MNQPWKVILAFLGVFLAGIVCGGPLAGWLRDRQLDNRPAFAERTMERFERELKLTEDQKKRILPILMKTQKEWRQARQENMRSMTAMLDRMHTELAAELNPEQREQLEKMRTEFRSRAERFRGRFMDRDRRPSADGPPPPR
jgi:hypothetical protein